MAWCRIHWEPHVAGECTSSSQGGGRKGQGHVFEETLMRYGLRKRLGKRSRWQAHNLQLLSLHTHVTTNPPQPLPARPPCKVAQHSPSYPSPPSISKCDALSSFAYISLQKGAQQTDPGGETSHVAGGMGSSRGGGTAHFLAGPGCKVLFTVLIIYLTQNKFRRMDCHTNYCSHYCVWERGLCAHSSIPAASQIVSLPKKPPPVPPMWDRNLSLI